MIARDFVPGWRATALGLGLMTLAACGESPRKTNTDSASPRAPATAQGAEASVAGKGTPSALGSAAGVAKARGEASAKASTATPPPANAPARRIAFGGVDFTGIGYDRGKADAPVVVIDLSDFACPYCGEFAHDVYPTIDRDYIQPGKVLFKYIPFVAGSFRHAVEATRAAECSADQGQFWVMMERLYITQAEWKSGNVADAQMAALAGTLPIDSTKFAACYASRRTDVRTARATAVANDIGVRVTPSFLVDGHPVQGALPLAEFRKLIETALLVESSRKPNPRGVLR